MSIIKRRSSPLRINTEPRSALHSACFRRQSYMASKLAIAVTTVMARRFICRCILPFLPAVLTGCIVGSISPNFVATLLFGSWFARD